MQPGYVHQTGEFDSEILRSGDFQLISVTLDSTAVYGADSTAATSTTIPKGTLIVQDTDLTDGTYNVVDSLAGNNGINGTPTQFMEDVLVLAETIVDASAGDQPVKAYIAGTFDWSKIKYTNSAKTAITAAQVAKCERLIFVDGPTT